LNISFKDDVTVILLLGVSYMQAINRISREKKRFPDLLLFINQTGFLSLHALSITQAINLHLLA
jgi:hypothetical protein